MPVSVNTADEYELVDHNDTALSDETLGQIRDWLEPTDYLAESGEFRRHILSQAPGTGLWICETEEYRKWHDSPDHGSLWIKGVPGAGKSVMAAAIIQHLRKTENCPVLFFFFRNIVASNFSPRALLQDWLAQLLPHSPKLQFALESRLGTSLAEVSDNDLIRLFIDGVTCVPKLYCVGDALDEMTTDNRSFLDQLNALATHRPRSLKLLMTSRPKQHLQSALRHSSIVHISLQQQLVDVDIMSYLNHRFDLAPKSEIHLKCKKEIVEMVATRSDGLFLYAKLTMDEVEASLLVEEPIDTDLLARSLPIGLEETYTKVLVKQRETHSISTDTQVLILEAVTHASRPLRLYELASLIQCISPDIKAPQGFKALITTSCGLLVEVLEDETLQVIHHSFTEFLRGDSRSTTRETASSYHFPIINTDNAHKNMAMHCLRYLQSGPLLLEDERLGRSAMDPSVTFALPQHQVELNPWKRKIIVDVEPEPEPDRFNYREARLLHPFLGYAVENWSHHASRYDFEDDEIGTVITDFLNPDSLALRRWLVLQWGSTTKTRDSAEGIPTALHIAAFAGLSKIASKLIQKGCSVSTMDAQERIPIHWAAANGYHKLVSLLLGAGSDPDAVDGRGLKPIHLAAKKNYSAVVKLLLEAGVNPNSVKTRQDHLGYPEIGGLLTEGDCAIFYASQAGHLETIISMIPFCKSELLEQMLCECCRFGRADAVLAILENSDVSVDATYCGGTALYLACGSASVKCVEALINGGANVDERSNWNPRKTSWGGHRRIHADATPLHHLVQVWSKRNDLECLAILRILSKAGVKMDQIDGDGNTALLLMMDIASLAGDRGLRTKVLKALLEAGADVKKAQKAVDSQMSRYDFAPVRMSPERNAGDTILHRALSRDCDLDTVRLLVEHGSDPNEMSILGETAFHYSIRRNLDDGIIKYFLEHGADLNIVGYHGRTAVEEAVLASGNLLQLLLSNSKNPAIKEQCWFMLQHQRDMDRFTIILELLLAEGMDIHARDREGRTLYLCCLDSSDKLLVLQEHGANTNDIDDDGNNSLHIFLQLKGNATGYYSPAQLQKFIGDGAHPLRRNNNGDTLLHHVATRYTGDPDTNGFVRWLVRAGVSVNSVNKRGLTALHMYEKSVHYRYYAEDVESCHLVHALGAENVDFEIRDRDGLGVLHLVAMKSWLDVVMLLEAGADIGFLTEDSQNVLHLACRARKFDMIGQILGHLGSIDVNQRDIFGRTPLYYACMSGEAESVALLLNHGVDVQVADSDLRTPIHACVEFRAEQRLWDSQKGDFAVLRGPPPDNLRPTPQEDEFDDAAVPWNQTQTGKPISRVPMTFFPQIVSIVKMLLEHNIDVSLLDKFGCTALDTALRQACPEVIEVFAADEELFIKATTELEKKRGKNAAFEGRQLMKAQMALMRHRSAMPVLSQDISIFEQVSKRPWFYLNLLSSEDVVKIIPQHFSAKPYDPSLYNLVRELMNPNRLLVVERIPPQLLLRFSSHESLKDQFKESTSMHDYEYHEPDLWTLLQVACQNSKPNLLMLKLLVEKFQVDVNEPCLTLCKDGIIPGGTALHLLASARHWWEVEAMRYLIANGAAVNARDESGQTPLHIAVRGSRLTSNNPRVLETCLNFQAVRILLDHGADVNALNDKGLSPLHDGSIAIHIMRELLREGADINVGIKDVLFRAIYDERLEMLGILLDHGVSVDSIDDGDGTRRFYRLSPEPRKMYAVVYAAFVENMDPTSFGSVQSLCALIERGANLYLTLNDNETMIHCIFENARYRVLDALLEEPCVSRIDFNNRDQGGRTVLMAACRMRKDELGSPYHGDERRARAPPVRMLDFGADATLVDNNGMTALHHILRNDVIPEQIVLDFIDRHEVQQTVSVRDKHGLLPFHYALDRSSLAVCNLLVSRGANLLEPDPNGLTVLHYIARRCFRASTWESPGTQYPDPDQPGDHFEQCLILWQRFLNAGGSINVADNNGNPPLFAYLSSRVNKNYSHQECHVDRYEKLFPAESRVDVFAVNNDGETALHIIPRRDDDYYAENGHDRHLFEFMMAKGLDPLKEDKIGRSALDVASACEKSDILHILGRK